MKPHIMFVRISDDWMALYINGHLACENHTISAGDVLRALGFGYSSVEAPAEFDTAPEKLPTSERTP